MRAISICFLAAIPLLSAGCSDINAPVSEPIAVLGAHPGLSSSGETVACGASIVANLKLGNDLFCPGDALIVSADGIEIDLNGHTITGSAVGVGITVRARRDVSIFGGTIRNFLTGIFVAQSTNVHVTKSWFTQNREAVFFNGSSGGAIQWNVAWQNTERGIMLRPTASGIISTQNLVTQNVLTANPSGILIFGQPGNTLQGNIISKSTLAGINLTGPGSSGNVVRENLLIGNAAGILFSTAGWTGNTFASNLFWTNTCGIQGSPAGNTVGQNRFFRNGSDFCP
jgi:parallel beta-helix repeat protein